MMQTQRQGNEQQQSVIQSVPNSGSLSFSGTLSKEDEEMSKSALTSFKAKEEEIEKRKVEVKEKVLLQLGRVEEETKRLAMIREEREYKEALEAFNEKNNEKVQLIAKLMELVSESERLRMMKLEKLSKSIDSMH
ncbi:RAB6-interacting golgin [Dillenia turbinata]|uniref:RAB6-interacting golgin n=1 Tax=Dillenia turbinata TaxID=194707 RepID=A0AAN8ZN65_9MAGN